MITYTYDTANRMTSAGGVAYTWDNNGNPSQAQDRLCSRMAPILIPSQLRSGQAYDRAHHLISVMSMPPAVTFACNCLGRIGEEGVAGWQYHLQNTMQKPHGILTCGGMHWAPCAS
jgi:hypothetical protein